MGRVPELLFKDTNLGMKENAKECQDGEDVTGEMLSSKRVQEALAWLREKD